MYSVKCILSAALVAALTCVTAHATVTTGGGSAVNPNPEYDTYVAQAASGTADTWEITLPNNTYNVTIACGDPSTATGPHYVALAGDGSTYSQVTALNVATGANVYATATNVSVLVTAGKLSLKLGGNSYANRINFIIISESPVHNSPVCASTSFGSIQDLDHWTYEYVLATAPGTYYSLTAPSDGATWTMSGARPKVAINNGSPAGWVGGEPTNPPRNAARTWHAPFDDTVNIVGWALRADPSSSGDGVTVRVVKQDSVGAETDLLTPISIVPSDHTYHNYSISSVSVLAGDKIHLIVDQNTNSNNDSTQLNAVISSASGGAAAAASNGFSSVQGQDNWTYEYYDGSTYTQLTAPSDGATWTMATARPKVWINGGAPAGWTGGEPTNILRAAVRTWTAPSTGTVGITGWAVRADTNGAGDGVTLKFIRNNEVSPLYSDTMTNSDYTYHRFSVASVAVTAGDKIHFNIDPRGPACSSCTGNNDSTKLDAVITYTAP